MAYYFAMETMLLLEMARVVVIGSPYGKWGAFIFTI
jgi:hypothetical protein